MLTAEQLEIRTLAREFSHGEIRPHTARWDERRELDDGVFAALAELGFTGMLVPDAHGGLGLDPVTYLLVLEELAWGDASVALSVAHQNFPWATVLVRHGSDEQKRRWLPALASGDTPGAFALWEDHAADPARLASVAERAGSGWRIRGTKRWVVDGARAELALVFARTSEGNGGQGVGAFLVEASAPGYRVTRRPPTMGLRALEVVDVELDGVEVGDDAVVGDPERGLAYGLEALDAGRASVGAVALGIARAAQEHALAYALEREQFGRPIAEFDAVRDKLAEMVRRTTAARALVHQAGRRMSAGAPGEEATPLAALAAMAKITASEAAMWASDEAVQIFGGYGYMRDYPVEKLMRDAKGTEILGGTHEVLRLAVGRDVLRRARHD